MFFAILALLGVVLWLCATGILVILMRNRKLRKRHGNIPVRVKRLGKQRWTRGQAIWSEDLVQVIGGDAAGPRRWGTEEVAPPRRRLPYRDAVYRGG